MAASGARFGRIAIATEAQSPAAIGAYRRGVSAHSNPAVQNAAAGMSLIGHSN